MLPNTVETKIMWLGNKNVLAWKRKCVGLETEMYWLGNELDKAWKKFYNF